MKDFLLGFTYAVKENTSLSELSLALSCFEKEMCVQKEYADKRYKALFGQSASTSPVFSHEARQQMARMIEATLRSRSNLAARLDTAQLPSQKGGFMAEEFHAESFNLDAILKDKDVRAITDQYKPEWDQVHLSKNDDVADIVITRHGKSVHVAQAKYGANAETTAGRGETGFSQIKDGRVKYSDADTYLAPSDQVTPRDGSVSIREHAEAAAQGNASRKGDPRQTEAYEQTARKVKSRLEYDDVSSSELSKEDATRMGEGDTSRIDRMESEYKTDSTVQQMGRAAAGAAAMAAIVCGTTNIVRYVQLASTGQISEGEAVSRILVETASSAADSAVKAGAVVGAQSLLVRYGSEKVIIETLSRQSLNALMKTNVITVGVACAVDAVKDLVALGTGRLTREAFFERQGKNILTTSSGTIGGTLGAITAESAVAALGFSAPFMAPLLGGLAGGLIAGLAMQCAVENHIDRPYRELVQNTEQTREAAAELQRISQKILGCQILFTRVMERENMLEKILSGQFSRIDEAGNRARSIIEKI